MNQIDIHTIFDPNTYTLTYILWDAKTSDAVVIDPVHDYLEESKTTSTENVQKVLDFVKAKNLRVQWILETHAHADHLSGALELKKHWPLAQWGMGATMSIVFKNFQEAFKWPSDVKLSDLGVDRWLKDGEEFHAGSIVVQAIATPGHTPACMTIKIGDRLFTGDALMMPDGGVGRCDFPGGSATDLYDSVWGKLYAYPDETRVYVGHDYQPDGRPLRYQTTIGEENATNIHLKASTSREDFIAFRESRDKTLAAPRLLNQSLDWNLGAYQLVKR